MRRLAGAVLLAALAGSALAQPAAETWRPQPGTWMEVQASQHNSNEGLAVSPDGRLVASTSMNLPGSELRLFDLAAGSGWRLAHPDNRVVLYDPTFSPDGARLAFVVSATFQYGISEIWIVGADGQGETVKVAERGRAYRHPAFSPDGTRIAYWRDVDAPYPADRPLDPNARYPVGYALFEYDLRTGTETRLAEQAFGNPSRVFYRPQDDGFYFGAMESLEPDPGPRGWRTRLWYETGEESDLAYQSRLDFTFVFLLKRGEAIARLPEPVVPVEGLTRRATLIGVHRDGRPILYSADPQITLGIIPPARVFVWPLQGETPQDLPQKAWWCSSFAADATGALVVAEADCISGTNPNNYRPKSSSLVLMRGGQMEVRPTARVAFEPAPRMLVPPPGSAFATVTPPPDPKRR